MHSLEGLPLRLVSARELVLYERPQGMRLLHVIPYYRPSLAFGGPVSICARLAEAMVERGHQVDVLTTDALSRSARCRELSETIDGVRVLRLRNVSQRAMTVNLYTPYPVRATLERLLCDADVVHVHEFFNWLSFRGATLAAEHRKPVLLSGHASLSVSEERGRILPKRIWLALFGRATIAAACAVQATMAYEAEQCVRAGVPPDRIRIIPQGVSAPPRHGDGAAFRARFGIDDRPIILFAGRLRASKGVDLLLEVARSLAAHPLRPLFVLAGAAENRPDLERPGMRLQDNALLTGALSETALDDAYAAASAFVLPSFAESMPLVVLDALAFGLPVVLSHACNLAEVEHRGAGILVDTDVGSLRAGIELLLERRDSWPQMGAAGREMVTEKYTSELVHDQYERVYRELACA